MPLMIKLNRNIMKVYLCLDNGHFITVESKSHKINIREIDYTPLSKDRNLPLMWSLDCWVIKVLTQIDLYLYSKV